MSVIAAYSDPTRKCSLFLAAFTKKMVWLQFWETLWIVLLWPKLLCNITFTKNKQTKKIVSDNLVIQNQSLAVILLSQLLTDLRTLTAKVLQGKTTVWTCPSFGGIWTLLPGWWLNLTLAKTHWVNGGGDIHPTQPNLYFCLFRHAFGLIPALEITTNEIIRRVIHHKLHCSTSSKV